MRLDLAGFEAPAPEDAGHQVITFGHDISNTDHSVRRDFTGLKLYGQEYRPFKALFESTPLLHIMFLTLHWLAGNRHGSPLLNWSVTPKSSPVYRLSPPIGARTVRRAAGPSLDSASVTDDPNPNLGRTLFEPPVVMHDWRRQKNKT